MQTLVFLADHPGQVIPRTEFFESVWQGLVVNEEALSRAISLLRTVLDDNARAPEYIQTIPGVGYRLIAEVSVIQYHAADPSPADGERGSSIAVLPFVNLSDDPGNEYFSDGISEEILNSLAQVRRFKVVGRTSSFAFKNRNVDLREIGKTLDVANVLEGSVRKAGNRVRITAQLIKTNDGFHLWSETFDRELDDIFSIQDEIASEVAQALKVRLLGDLGEYLVTGGTRSTRAYQAYLLGQHYRNRGALKESVWPAKEAFQDAIRLDPGYARAHTGLAYVLNDLVWNGYVTQEEGMSQAKEAAMKAIELAPDLADGHLALGISQQLDIPINPGALDAISTAQAINPRDVRVLIEYARLHCNIGNHDVSVASARKALELEPISVYANHFLGHVLYFGRRFEEAIPAFRQALQLDPHYPKPHYFISMSLYWLGETEAAMEEARLEPLDWMRWTATTVIAGRLGRIEEAERAFASLAEIGVAENNFKQQADIHAQLGETDQAFECLDQAFALRDPGLTQLLVDPFLDPIRDDPRFAGMLEKVGFSAEMIKHPGLN